MDVAGNGSKIRTSAQFAFQLENPVIVVVAIHLRGQVIRHTPHAAQRNCLKRRGFQRRQQSISRKKPRSSSVKIFFDRLGGEVLFRILEIAAKNRRLQYFSSTVAHENREHTRRIPLQPGKIAQDSIGVVDVFQNVMAENDIEGMRIEKVLQLISVAVLQSNL